jgi:hypothetical protein
VRTFLWALALLHEESRMAFYLVSAVPRQDLMEELRERLGRDEFVNMRPFGKALTKSLKSARLRRDGVAVWEEEDYCSPPLAQERAAVLDTYFQDIRVEPVEQGAGWRDIEALSPLFPELVA